MDPIRDKDPGHESPSVDAVSRYNEVIRVLIGSASNLSHSIAYDDLHVDESGQRLSGAEKSA